MSKSVVERRLSGWRLGAALVGLAIPFAVALPAAAQSPSPSDVADTASTCAGLGFSTSDCAGAIKSGLVDVAEAAVNSTLSNEGIDLTINTGIGTPPLTVTPNSGNPPVPLIPVPPVPGITY
ncbi:MAG TPA: hypothetical protein VFQ80_13200 [Thermomicrobiales bacterium]|jgi:hypothetical protein|nr:hypothetical protein [Thermomicrobiales bacterium]